MARRFHYRRPRTRTRYLRSAPRRRRYFGGFRRRMKSKTIPLSYIPALAVPLGFCISGDSHMMGWYKAATQQPENLLREVGNSLAYQTIGYDPNQGSFDWTIPARNIALIGGGYLVHRLARGVNSKIRNIPFIGKYVSI